MNADDELYALWQVANVNAVQRLGMSDHGPVHVQIVTNIALRLLRRLADADSDEERRLAREAITEARASVDGREGLSAFLQKRKPRWLP